MTIVNIKGEQYRVEDVEEALHLYYRRRVKRTAINSPKNTRSFLRLELRNHEHEVFGMICLDNRNRIIERKDIFRGTIDGASVYPREVVKEVLAVNAAAVILYHNHPSGVAEPSQADEIITRRLRDALALVDVRILDHVIVGADGEITSFAERGLL